MALFVTSCKQEQVQVYEVQVDSPRGQREEIKYTSPEGWTEVPGGSSMSAAFRLPSQDGSLVEASFRQFGDMSGSEPFVINMVRSEAQKKDPLEENEIRKLMKTIQIGDSYGQVFEVISKDEIPTYQGKLRIVVAMLHRAGGTWFFKYTGNETESTRNDAGFRKWLADMTFEKVQSQPAPQTPAPAPDLPDWDTPENWTNLGPARMVNARYEISQNDKKAVVSISNFPGQVGGLEANVNRWRRNAGLGAMPLAEIEKNLKYVESDGNQAILVDLTSKEESQTESILAVWDYREKTQTSWFYKLQGDFDVVDSTKEEFFKFIESIKYP